MIYTFVVLVAFTPVFLWVKYLHERTGTVAPLNHLCPAFLAGMAITYPALLIQNLLIASPASAFAWLHDLALVQVLTQDGEFALHFVRAFVLGGFVEEFLKLMAVLALVWVLKRTIRPVSLILIAVAVGGAFAAVENVFYSVNSPDWGRMGALRALISMPSHVFLGIIMGFLLGCAWKSQRGRYVMSCLAFLMPALLHGTANYLLHLGLLGIEPPGVTETVARLFHGFVLVGEALFAIMILARVSRMGWGGPREGGARQDAMGHRHLGFRRVFWAQAALIIGAFGAVNLLMFTSDTVGWPLAHNLGGSFLIGAMSLIYAVAIWGHAQTQAAVAMGR